MRCHYDVLGLDLTANNDEIKKAYRKSALQWHPGNYNNISIILEPLKINNFKR